MRKPVYSYLATAAWWLAIWAVSSIPSKDLPSVQILSLDKLAHIFVYLVLAVLVNRSMRLAKAKRSTVLTLYLILFASAALDEYHQSFIPGRSVTWWDFMANGIGLGIGLTVYLRTHDQGKRTSS